MAKKDVSAGTYFFFGIGFINLAFAFTISQLRLSDNLAASSWLLIIGAITMPLCCYSCAFWKGFRHLFVVPVVSLVLGVALLISRGLMQ